MDIYKKNMEYMQKYQNYLYNNLTDKIMDLPVDELDYIASKEARNGEFYLTIKVNDKTYRLNSEYNPSHEAKVWIDQYNFIDMNIVITIFGLGNGTFVRELIKNKQQNDFLLIYEPSPQLFLHILNTYDITDILSNNSVILVVLGVNEFLFRNYLQNKVTITNLTSQIHCMHPSYEQVFPEAGIKYWKELKDNYVHTKININTEMHFAERFIINASNNVKHLYESNRLLDLQSDFDFDVPAIIVAAGPSLRKNIDELKKAKGKSYIFVVDRILDYVLDEGVVPDFIVTIDPIKPLSMFSKRDNLTIPLMCDLSSNSEILDFHKGKKIFFSAPPFFQQMYQNIGMAPPSLITGASVATSAFSACVLLGFKRIVLVGQDLAYDGEYTHANGEQEDKNKNQSLTNMIYVEGIDGNKVRSRQDWYEFLGWFKDIMTIYPDVEVIDTKDQGAKIQGAIVMPLKEVVEKYCIKSVDIDLKIKEREIAFTEHEFSDIKKFLKQSFDDLHMLSRKSKEAIDICHKQIRIYKSNNGETSESEKNFKKISKINKYIDKLPVFKLLGYYITAKSAKQLSEIYHFTEDIQIDRIDTYKKTASIYQAIIDGVKFSQPLFENMLEIMNITT